MQSFEFKMPTEIIFGRHAEDRVAEKLRAYGAASTSSTAAAASSGAACSRASSAS